MVDVDSTTISPGCVIACPLRLYASMLPLFRVDNHYQSQQVLRAFLCSTLHFTFPTKTCLVEKRFERDVAACHSSAGCEIVADGQF